MLGPHQDLWLCDLLSDGWHEQPLNEVVEALAPNTPVQFLFLPHHNTSLHNNLSTCLQFVRTTERQYIGLNPVVFQSTYASAWTSEWH